MLCIHCRLATIIFAIHINCQISILCIKKKKTHDGICPLPTVGAHIHFNVFLLMIIEVTMCFRLQICSHFGPSDMLSLATEVFIVKACFPPFTPQPDYVSISGCSRQVSLNVESVRRPERSVFIFTHYKLHIQRAMISLRIRLDIQI